MFLLSYTLLDVKLIVWEGVRAISLFKLFVGFGFLDLFIFILGAYLVKDVYLLLSLRRKLTLLNFTKMGFVTFTVNHFYPCFETSFKSTELKVITI